MTDENKIKLSEVSKSDYKFLYELLKKRDSCVNISHKKIPSYNKHVKFVMSKPYSKWYIIEFKSKKVGSVYLSKQDEIGIYIKKEFRDIGIGKKSVELLMGKNPRSRYLVNIAPKNTKTQKFFKKLGFTGLQYTYEIRKSI